jgi:lipopolysaccharide assembly outer membrane protein LptD (OstA)
LTITYAFGQNNAPEINQGDITISDSLKLLKKVQSYDTLNNTDPDMDSISVYDSTAVYTLPMDSIAIDTLQSDSTLVETDSIPPVGDIETTIKYSARDSMNLNLTRQLVDLYGDGKIVYGDIELNADRINVDYEIHEIQAEGSLDSLDNPVGEPVFKDGNDVYETEKMRYNFKSEKA